MRDKCYDKLDREITEGCFIVYATQVCDSARLRVGRVEAIKLVKHPWRTNDEKWHITVTGVNEDWDGKCSLGKKGTLQFSDRCVVIDKKDLATKYRVLFSSGELV